MKILSNIIKFKKPSKTDEKKIVASMIFAYSEEEVFYDNFKNAIDNDFPKDKI